MDARSSETELSARELAARVATAFGALFSDIQRSLTGEGGTLQREVLMALAVRGSRLADDLLSYAAAQTLAPQALDPRTLLHALARDLREMLEARFEVVVRVAEGCPTFVADAAALEAALLGAIANARDSMPDGGVVELLAEPARLGDGTPAVELAVRDRGCGVGPRGSRDSRTAARHDQSGPDLGNGPRRRGWLCARIGRRAAADKLAKRHRVSVRAADECGDADGSEPRQSTSKPVIGTAHR